MNQPEKDKTAEGKLAPRPPKSAASDKSANERTNDSPSDRTPGRTLGAIVLLLMSGFYILNPTAGIFELIPDNLPLLGNLDEAAAVAMLLAALRYFGIDVTKMMSSRKKIDGD